MHATAPNVNTARANAALPLDLRALQGASVCFRGPANAAPTATAGNATLLLIDNYDSFTYNLAHYLGELGAKVEVRRNDAVTVAEAMAMPVSGIVLSPGPRSPDFAGICLELVAAAAEAGLPTLGVCLGHQAIGQAFGGRIVQHPEIVHGKLGAISHAGEGVFSGLPTPFEATRYHSLVVARDSLPDSLSVTAQTPDGAIMGLQHRELPLHGVQYTQRVAPRPPRLSSHEGSAAHRP